MAVQSQYPSPAFRVRNSIFEDPRQHLNDGGQHHLLNGAVFSEPESELTCNNVSGSRKRYRDEHHHMLHPAQFRFPKLPKPHIGVNILEATSTSGRSSGNSPFLLTSNAHDLQSQLLYQDREMEELMLMQNEKLRLGLEQARTIHCKSLLSMLESKVLRKLEEKETQLANARRVNAELEDKLMQKNAENQVWFQVAKKNEAIVSTLKSSIEQILFQSQGKLREGFGDSDSVADDASSSASSMEAEKMIRENIELKGRKSCKVCHENEVSVLLVPCRHLCLCKNCESKIDSCPICKSLKTTSLQIFMS